MEEKINATLHLSWWWQGMVMVVDNTNTKKIQSRSKNQKETPFISGEILKIWVLICPFGVPFSGTMGSKKVGWNRTIKRWSTFCTGAPSPYSTTVINWPNKECPLCYLKRHKPGHRRTIKDIVLNLLPLEMDFSRAKLPFRLSGVWKAWRIIFWTFTLTVL